MFLNRHFKITLKMVALLKVQYVPQLEPWVIEISREHLRMHKSELCLREVQ